MNIVEISGSLGNGLKRYNVFEQVSISHQPFTQRASVLYGLTKPTDIVQTYPPTNILMDSNNKPIGNSKPVYFGIRVYPFISARQQVNCGNNNITYGRFYGLSSEYYFPNQKDFKNLTLIPQAYTGQLYPEPIFEDLPSASQQSRMNYQQAMQQFINDCAFPTKPKLNLPSQSQSDHAGSKGIGYFASQMYQTPEINRKEPTGILCVMEDNTPQFNGQKLNFKFGMADNLDFAEVPNIYIPYLYRTYVALVSSNPRGGVSMGVIMQCLLYDNLGDVITG